MEVKFCKILWNVSFVHDCKSLWIIITIRHNKQKIGVQKVFVTIVFSLNGILVSMSCCVQHARKDL